MSSSLTKKMSSEELARYINRRWPLMKTDQAKFDFIAKIEKVVGEEAIEEALPLVAESKNPESAFLATAMIDQSRPSGC